MKIDLKFHKGELHIEREPMELDRLRTLCGVLYAAIGVAGFDLLVYILKL